MVYKQILVPVAGNEVDEESMRLACRLSKKEKGKVWAVYVVAIKRALPLDAEITSESQRAEDVLTSAEAIGEEEECEVETDILQAREIGPAIIESISVRLSTA